MKISLPMSFLNCYFPSSCFIAARSGKKQIYYIFSGRHFTIMPHKAEWFLSIEPSKLFALSIVRSLLGIFPNREPDMD